MAEKQKFTKEQTSFLRDLYVGEVEKHGGAAKVTKEWNALFFAHAGKMPALEGFSVPQLRGSLIISGAYIATAPRTAPKKAGKCKADLLAELTNLTGVELSSGMKLTMMDLEALIAAWPTAEWEEDAENTTAAE